LTFSSANAAPIVDLNGAGGGNDFAASYTEGGTAAAIAAADATVTDADADPITSFSATITNPVAGDRLTLTGTYGTITGANIAGSGTATLTITGSHSAADVADALRAITFSSTSDDPTNAARTIQVVVNDGTANSVTRTTTMSVTPVNDAPTLTATGGTPTFTEGDAAPGADLFSGVTISTIEAGQTITGLTLTISNVTNGASEILRIDGSDVALTNGNSVLTATNGLTVNVSVTGATATVSFASAGLTTAAAQTLVDGLAYRNTSENPTEATRVATITQIRDSGGTASGGVDTASPNVAATVTVVGVNDAPTLTGGGTLAAVDEDTANPPGAALNALGITAADVDGTVTGYAIVGNTANAGTQGSWQYSTNGGTNWFAVGAVADDATALALSSATLVRFVPAADFNGAPPALTIRAVDSSYGGSFSSTAGTETRATLNAAANGGATAVSAATAAITTSITAVNDAPVNAVPGAQATDEDTALVFSGGNGNAITVSDVDTASVTVTLTATNGVATLGGTAGLASVTGNGTASVVLSGTLANVNAALNGLTFTPTADFSGAATLRIVTSDGALSDDDTVAITVNAVNDAPTLTGGGALPAVNEDTASPAGAAINTLGIAAGDVDGTVAVYAVVGNAANPATQGVWQYSTNGGANWFAIGAVADGPTALALSHFSLLRFVPAADFNGVPGALTIRALDNTYTAGQSSTGPTENRITVDTTTTGGATPISAATAAITTSITPVNDAPVLTATAADPTYVENVGTASLLAGGAAVTDVDIANAATTGTVTGATLTVSLTTGAYQAQDVFGIADVNGITFDAGTGQVTIGGDVVATRVGGLGANAVVTFTALASLNGVNAVLGALVYSNAGDDPTQGGTNATRAYQIVYNDGALDTGAVTGTVTITAVNDAPVVTTSGGSAAYVENAAGVPIDPTLTVSDPDSGTLATATVSITAGFQAGADVLAFVNDGATMGNIAASYAAGTGILSLTSAGGTATLAQWTAALRAVTYANTSEDPSTAARTVSVVVNDGGAASTAATRGVTVTAVNDAPTNDPAFGFVNAGASTETGGIVTITNAMLDEGDPDDSGAGVTYTVTTAPTNGTLFRDANANGIVDGGEALGLNATFTQADIDGGLIKYLHGGGGGSSDSFGFSVADGGEDGATPLTGQTFSITIAARPVLAIGGGAPAHVEDADATVVAPNLTLSDADSANLTGATVTITDRVAGDVLGFTDQNGITGSYNTGTGVLTLTGTATLASYQAALRSITYSTTNDNPATGAGNADRVISFTVTDGALNSTAQSQTVGVTNANDAPVLDATQSPALTGIAEDLDAPTNGSTANSTLVSALLGGMSDVDTGALQGLAVTAVSAQITLWYSLDGGTTWTQVPAVTAGAALLLQSDARLYVQPAANLNGTIADALTVRAWDRTSGTNGGTADTTTNGGGTAFSNATDTVSVTISAVNDAPVLTVPGAIAVTEDLASALTGISIADVDAGAGAVTLTLSVPSGTLAATGGGGVTVGGTATALTLTGTLADINAFVAANGVTFTTAANATANVTLTVAVTDNGNTGSGGALGDTETVTLTVTAVDDAPTLGGLVLGQAVTDKTTIQPFGTATIADVDSANVTVTVTLDTAAKGSFTTLAGFADAGGGVYTFTGAPGAAQTALRALVFTPAENRVAPGATETTTFTVAVADATSSTQGAASVVATSVNDAPTAAGFVAGQGATDNATVSPFSAVTVSDPDTGQPLTVSVTLDDAAKGAFTAASLAATGFTTAGGGVYTLTAADAAAAQAALRGLVYAPAANRVPVGANEVTAFTVSVSDGVAAAVVDTTTSVVATSVNDAPTAAVSLPPQFGELRQSFSLVLPAGLFADVDVGDVVTVTVEGLPAGLRYDAATRTILGEPQAQGVTTISVIGTDAVGARTVISVPFTSAPPPVLVEPAPPPPPPAPDLPPPPVQIVPLPASTAPVEAAPPPAENFGGVGGGVGGGLPTPEPIVVPGPIADPVFPRASFFVSTPEAGYTPGFGIRADSVPAEISMRGGAGPISFALPAATFVVERAGVQVLVGATLGDGSPLPAWVEFDPATGTFRIDAPPGFTGELTVVLSASLPTGESASTELRIVVEAEEAALEPGAADDADSQQVAAEPAGSALRNATVELAPTGKPAFSEVVKAASRGAWVTQGQQLLDDLIAVLPVERPSGDNEGGSREGREAA